jgi:hypothetical protein
MASTLLESNPWLLDASNPKKYADWLETPHLHCGNPTKPQNLIDLREALAWGIQWTTRQWSNCGRLHTLREEKQNDMCASLSTFRRSGDGEAPPSELCLGTLTL